MFVWQIRRLKSLEIEIRWEKAASKWPSCLNYRKPLRLISRIPFFWKTDVGGRRCSLTHADAANGINVSVTRFRVTIRLPNPITLIGRFPRVFLLALVHRHVDTRKGHKRGDRSIKFRLEKIRRSKSWGVHLAQTSLACGTKVEELSRNTPISFFPPKHLCIRLLIYVM